MRNWFWHEKGHRHPRKMKIWRRTGEFQKRSYVGLDDFFCDRLKSVSKDDYRAKKAKKRKEVKHARQVSAQNIKARRRAYAKRQREESR